MHIRNQFARAKINQSTGYKNSQVMTSPKFVKLVKQFYILEKLDRTAYEKCILPAHQL